MKGCRIICISIFVVLIFAVGALLYSNNFKSSDLSECRISDECILPGEYAIQSNCPYEAYCDNGNCVIGCPIAFGSIEEEGSICIDNSECDCSSRGERSIRCACIDDKCVSIEEE